MSDPRSVIDRELERVDLRPFIIQAFHRRREQKRRRQRIAAGVVGVTVGLFAVLIGTSIVRSGPAPTPASPHPPQPAPRQAELTFSDDAGIVAIDLASGRRHVVAPGVSAAAVSWSPDGSALVYESTTEPCSVVIRDIETGEDRVLASCGSSMRYGASVDWSADGAWIAFSTSSNGGPGSLGRRIVLIHPDGTGEKPVTDTDGVPIERRSVLVVARRFSGRLRSRSRDRRDERRRDGAPVLGERHVAGLVHRWFHDRLCQGPEPAALPAGQWRSVRLAILVDPSGRLGPHETSWLAALLPRVRGRQDQCGRLTVHRSREGP